MYKTVITRKIDNSVMFIASSTEEAPNGILMHFEDEPDIILGCAWECDIYENVEVPQDVIPHKYLYTEANGFTLNPNYRAYTSDREEIISLRDKNEALQDALVETQNALNMLLGV